MSEVSREAVIRLLSDRRFLPACFMVFVGVRLLLILLVPVTPGSDAQWYFSRAVTLAEQGTYTERGIPTAYWPVGYPALLGLLFRLTGPSLLAAQFANLAFAAMSFWLLYFCVRKMLDDELSARVGVFLLTVYPNNAAYVPLLYTETFYTCLLLSASLLLLSSRNSLYAVCAGIIFGVATLVKTQTIMLTPVLAFLSMWDTWSFRTVPKAIVRAVIVTMIALAVIAPWTIRNYRTFGEFVLVSTNGGVALLAGNNPSMVGNYHVSYIEDEVLFKKVQFSVEDQIGADRRARVLAQTWIREHPGDFMRLVPQKIFRLWAIDGEGEWGYQEGTSWYDQHSYWFRAVRIINQLFYVIVILLVIASVVKLLRHRASPRAYFGIAVGMFFTFISVVFSGQSRYHFPVMPFAIAYAAWFCTTWSLRRST